MLARTPSLRHTLRHKHCNTHCNTHGKTDGKTEACGTCGLVARSHAMPAYCNTLQHMQCNAMPVHMHRITCRIQDTATHCNTCIRCPYTYTCTALHARIHTPVYIHLNSFLYALSSLSVWCTTLTPHTEPYSHAYPPHTVAPGCLPPTTCPYTQCGCQREGVCVRERE